MREQYKAVSVWAVMFLLAIAAGVIMICCAFNIHNANAELNEIIARESLEADSIIEGEYTEDIIYA